MIIRGEMKSQPVIAMPIMGTSLLRRYIRGTYISALRRAGAEVKVLAETADRKTLEKEMRCCDGLLLPGGADIYPGCYGEKVEACCGKPNMGRDGMEFPLLDITLNSQKPVLGICRGMQVINVACGGTLYQDISTIQRYKHMDLKNRHRVTHPVTLAPGSLIRELFPAEEIQVNSLHHQAVRQVGKGLQAIAVSKDGFVEGIQLEDYPFCVGVQWHPEQMAKRDYHQQAVFDRFVKAV